VGATILSNDCWLNTVFIYWLTFNASLQDLGFCYLHMSRHQLQVIDTYETAEYFTGELSDDGGSCENRSLSQISNTTSTDLDIPEYMVPPKPSESEGDSLLDQKLSVKPLSLVLINTQVFLLMRTHLILTEIQTPSSTLPPYPALPITRLPARARCMRTQAPVPVFHYIGRI
jgi:hypothetical protein